MPRQRSADRPHPFAIASSPQEVGSFTTRRDSGKLGAAQPLDSRRTGVLSVVLDSQERNTWWWEAGTASPPISADCQTTTFGTQLGARPVSNAHSLWVSDRLSLLSTDSNVPLDKKPEPLATWPWERNETPIAALRVFNTVSHNRDERQPAPAAVDTYPPTWEQRFVTDVEEHDRQRHEHQRPRSEHGTIVSSILFQDSQPSASATDVSFYPRSTPSPSSFDHRGDRTETSHTSHRHTVIDYPYGTRQYDHSPVIRPASLAVVDPGDANPSPTDQSDVHHDEVDNSEAPDKSKGHRRYSKSAILAHNTFYLPPLVLENGRGSFVSLGGRSAATTRVPPPRSLQPSQKEPTYTTAATFQRNRTWTFGRCCRSSKQFDDEPPSSKPVYLATHPQHSSTTCRTYASNTSSCFSGFSRKYANSEVGGTQGENRKMTTALEIEAALHEHEWRANVLSQAVEQSLRMPPLHPPKATITKKSPQPKLSRSSNSGYVPIRSGDSPEKARPNTLEKRRRQVSFPDDEPAPVEPVPPLPSPPKSTLQPRQQTTAKTSGRVKGKGSAVPFPISNAVLNGSSEPDKTFLHDIPHGSPSEHIEALGDYTVEQHPPVAISPHSPEKRNRSSAASATTVTQSHLTKVPHPEPSGHPELQRVLQWRSTITVDVPL